MGVFNSSLQNKEIKEEYNVISINQQITLAKNKIYEDRATIYKNIVKNQYIDCYCGCKYNKIFTSIKQTNINDYTLIVEGNIDIIYNEVLKAEDEYRENIRENLKKCKNTYLHNLKKSYDGINSISKNPIHLSNYNNKRYRYKTITNSNT